MILKKGVLSFILTAGLSFCLVSCGVSDQHSALDKHRWSAFKSDDIEHWRTCLDESCEAVSRAAHKTELLYCMQTPTCDICGNKYGAPTPHDYNDNGECIRCGERERGEGLDYFHADDCYIVTGIGKFPYEDVEISPVHKGLPVTEINSHAFSKLQTLHSIIIPDTVETVGWAAFSGCENLTSVTLSKSMKTIEGSLFHSCTSLFHVDIPDGVTIIGDRAFYHCEALEELTIPASITHFDGHPFGSCASLKHIVYQGTTEQWQAIDKADDAIPENVIVSCTNGEIVFD